MSPFPPLTVNAKTDFDVARVARLREVLRKHFAGQRIKKPYVQELSNVFPSSLCALKDQGSGSFFLAQPKNRRFAGLGYQYPIQLRTKGLAVNDTRFGTAKPAVFVCFWPITSTHCFIGQTFGPRRARWVLYPSPADLRSFGWARKTFRPLALK